MHADDLPIPSEEGRDDSYMYTKNEAHEAGLMGWMMRCNRCGTYGASIYNGEAEDGSPLRLCPLHARELKDEYKRHRKALKVLREKNYD